MLVSIHSVRLAQSLMALAVAAEKAAQTAATDPVRARRD